MFSSVGVNRFEVLVDGLLSKGMAPYYADAYRDQLVDAELSEDYPERNKFSVPILDLKLTFEEQ